MQLHILLKIKIDIQLYLFHPLYPLLHTGPEAEDNNYEGSFLYFRTKSHNATSFL